MTKEIKEIFRRMNDLIEHQFDKEYHTECDLFKDIQNLLDYITNLQQDLKAQENLTKSYCTQNQELKQENEKIKGILFQSANNTNKSMELTEIYKSRCDKAIEYINFVIKHYKEQLKTPIEDTYFDSDVNRKGYILSIIAYLQTTLDTLIGSDGNE